MTRTTVPLLGDEAATKLQEGQGGRGHDFQFRCPSSHGTRSCSMIHADSYQLYKDSGGVMLVFAEKVVRRKV